MTEGALVIRSEEDAWEALQNALSDQGISPQAPIRFSGWPTYGIKIDGKDWHQSVPTRIMPALMAMQSNIYKTYAEIRYFDGSVHRLTQEERDFLELVVNVGKGSTLFGVDLEKVLNTIVEQVAHKMTSTDLVKIIIAISLIAGTAIVSTSYIDAQVRKLEIQTEAETKNNEIVARAEASVQETERLKLIARVAEQHSPVAENWSREESTTREFLKRLKPEDAITIGKRRLLGDVAKEIAKAPPVETESIVISGEFRIVRVDSSGRADFKVRVSSIDDGEEFNVFVPLGLNMDQQKLIQQAEWTRSSIHLDIMAERFRGLIREASVTSARLPKQGPDEN